MSTRMTMRPIWVLTSITMIGGLAAVITWLPSVRMRVGVTVAVGVAVITVCAAPARTEYVRFTTPAWNTHPLREFLFVARAIEADLEVRLGPGAASPRPVYEDHDWRHLEFLLPRTAASGRFHEVVPETTPTWTPAGDDRELGVVLHGLLWRP